MEKRRISGFVGRLVLGIVLGVGIVSTMEGNRARLINQQNQDKKVSNNKEYAKKLNQNLEYLIYTEDSYNGDVDSTRANKYYYTNIYDIYEKMKIQVVGNTGEKKAVLTTEHDEYKNYDSRNVTSSNVLDNNTSGFASDMYDEKTVRLNQKADSWKRLKKQAAQMYANAKSNNYKWPCNYTSYVKDSWGRDFSYDRTSPTEAKISYNLPWDNSKVMSFNLIMPDQARLIVQNGMKDYQSVKATSFTAFSSYMIKYDGTLWVAGDNGFGQLGLGDTTVRTSFIKVPNLENVKKVYTDDYVGSRFAMALTESGDLYSAGFNSDAHLGTGDTNSPNIWVKVLDNVNDVYYADSTGGGILSTYAVKKDGTLWVAGDNAFGQLGLGDKVTKANFIQAPGITNVKKVYTYNRGQRFAFVLTEDGKLYAAGNHITGQLGAGAATTVNTWTQMLTNVKDLYMVVSSGITDFSTYVIKNDGTLWVTGDNAYGQLGLGNKTLRKTFIQVPGISNAEKIYTVEMGNRFAFLLTENGDLYSAGNNAHGFLGAGPDATYSSWQHVLTGVRDLKFITSTDVANISSYAIKKDGTLWVAGENGVGQLGLGDLADKRTFVEASAVPNVKEVIGARKGSRTAFALTTNGDLFATGYNNDGCLGYGNSADLHSWQKVLTEVDNLKLVSKSEGSYLSSYAVRYDGTLWTSGNNQYGQLGLGNKTNQNSFIDTGLTNVEKAFSSFPGPRGVFVLKNDKSVYAAGRAMSAYLGTGSYADQVTFKEVMSAAPKLLDECN